MFDHIVIGAGIEGLCTALELAQRNHSPENVLLLEQFPFLHGRGSSNGQTRIARVWHTQHPITVMMDEAFELWRSFEVKGDCQLMTPTGILHIGSSDASNVDASFKFTQRQFPGILEELDYETFSKEYPMLNYSPRHKFYFDITGAVLLANKALQTVLALFKKLGGTFKDMCKVNRIDAGPVIKVHTTLGTFDSPSLVICAGAWTNKLLSSLDIKLPLQARRARVLYWKEKEAQHMREQGFPCVVDIGNTLYTLPSIEYPGYLKISTYESTAGEPCDPDERENIVHTDREASHVRNCIREHFTYVEDILAVEEACLYTITPDRMWILDRLPGHSNIVVGTGFSGSGFKAAPVVGKVLTELAMNLQTSYDLSPFSLTRFHQKGHKQCV